MAGADPEKYPSIPSNYVSIAQLHERWLKEKQRQQQQQQQQEKEKQEAPLHQKHSINVQKGENHSEKYWPEVGLTIAKEPKLKEVKKRGYFGKRKNQEMTKVSTFNVAKVETVVSVENGDKELSKGKYQLNRENKKGVSPIIHRVSNHVSSGSENSRLSKDKQVKVSNGGLLDLEISCLSKDKEVKEGVVSNHESLASGFSQLSDDKEVKGGESVIHRVSNCMPSVSEISQLAKDKEVKGSESVIHRVSCCAPSASEISQLSKDKEVKEMSSVCMVEVVGENKVDREIAGQRSRDELRGKKDSSRIGHSVEEEVSVNVKERGNKKASVRAAFQGYGDKRRYVPLIENIERDSYGKSSGGVYGDKCRCGSSRNGTGDDMAKEGTITNSENKEINEVSTVYMVEVVGENKVDRKIAGQRSKVGFKGKKDSRRMKESVEQSRQEHNAEKEEVSVNVKERSNEKGRVRGASRRYGDKGTDVRGNVSNIGMAMEEIMTVESVDNGGKELPEGKYQLKSENKEIKEMCNVYLVEVVGENKVDKEIPILRSRVGFSVKKDNRRMMGIKVEEVGDKADSVEQSQQENNAEEKVVSDNVKEIRNEKVTVRGGNGDKRRDVPLVDPEVNMKIDSNFGNLSLSDRKYGYERSSDRVHGDKWRYGSLRSYEPRRMLKRRDSSFVWVKKGDSSNGDVAEIETQVDSSSQCTSQSQLCSQ